MTTSPQDESTNINNPELDDSGKVTRRSITSKDQAYGIARQLEDNNRDRNNLNSIILRKYNGGQPYDPEALKANLEDWRSNAPTGFMSGIVDRITPTPMQAIDSARYLTSAKLYDGDDSDKKSEYFRQAVTNAIRRWNGWRDFLSSLWQEDILIGQAAPLNLDPYSPWPKMFKGDEVFFPEGTGQHAKTVQVFSAKEDLLLHEFVNLIKDYPDIDSGWDFENCIKVVNEALPKNTVVGNDGEQQARKWEDAIREGNVGASHSGAKVVELYHTLAVEADTQKVTHYIVNRRGEHEELFFKGDRFEKMEDVTTLFTLQPANGKYYASKGVGRMLLNAHIVIERSRNGMLDNLNLAGLKILKVPANQAPSLQLKMASPLMVVAADGEFEQHGISTNVQDYIAADDAVAKWTEQLVGSYISGLRGNESPDRTATEANIDANRDAQAKTAFLARAWGQFADLVSQITRRLCDPETTDEIAKALQKELKDPEKGNLSDEEINQLKNAPSAEVVQDLTQMHNQQIVAVFQVLKGDPNINQDELYQRFLSAAVNPQFAKDVFLDKQGLQANEIEALRQQQLETEAILAGAPGVPVSPRDPHDVHLKTIFSDLKAGIPKIAQAAHDDPSVLDHMNAQLVHSKAHIGMMKNQGASPQTTQPFEKAQTTFETILNDLAKGVQQARRNAPVNAPQAPPPPPNTPQGLTPPQGAQNEPTVNGMSEKLLAAWVGQYQNLRSEEQRRLEQISGLGSAPDSAPQENVIHTAPPAVPAPPPTAPAENIA